MVEIEREIYRIEIDISITSNDVTKPLLTPDGNNKIQPIQSNPNNYSTIQFPKSNVYKTKSTSK
ncbi:hypothetical protein DDB_G0285235 [Dictyostelium discoideum AX4]|uniref:Uncharacterized protein n=1 Tax=Dictyostelium discoideum TaxID=44689 RepID=Q54NJ1_DICDI|nr:hypothetical protein DDB_G0285235 [Dictyostelium discoideum AX4]EAL64829.1 hypothetical protein DDB_G0285235 [Dictyostelium discoideum AX4]|eukprot:XP_638326.1 hypothetical protein DDB_G0285235 [Dictyostelium discoideum AX4]